MEYIIINIKDCKIQFIEDVTHTDESGGFNIATCDNDIHAKVFTQVEAMETLRLLKDVEHVFPCLGSFHVLIYSK